MRAWESQPPVRNLPSIRGQLRCNYMAWMRPSPLKNFTRLPWQQPTLHHKITSQRWKAGLSLQLFWIFSLSSLFFSLQSPPPTWSCSTQVLIMTWTMPYLFKFWHKTILLSGTSDESMQALRFPTLKGAAMTVHGAVKWNYCTTIFIHQNEAHWNGQKIMHSQAMARTALRLRWTNAYIVKQGTCCQVSGNRLLMQGKFHSYNVHSSHNIPSQITCMYFMSWSSLWKWCTYILIKIIVSFLLPCISHPN